ncbi:MAG TPA: GNAT family N-acetyltransferase [Sphingomicrobium sp.]|nr:GNAT family N-acetyltransferase [Sphingomicrobium sp.]
MYRASTAVPEYQEQLEENPEAIDLPFARIEHGQVIVAEGVEGTAGFIVLVIEEDQAELDGLFVEPHFWGRGVGKTLVELAAHEALRVGLSLTVVAAPGARGFYERCGFTVEGETETRFGPALIMSR